jgi:malate dehydrogenase (oxaloacetate-decarboxylating)
VDKRIVINGAGASASATANLLMELSAQDVIVCDSKGALSTDRSDLNEYKTELAKKINPRKVKTLTEALRGADIFIGLSVANQMSKEMVRSMNADPVVFALANPDPEILPPEAKEAGARFTGSGRFDFANPVNNLLAFPGIVCGTIDANASKITLNMKLAAVKAIADFVSDDELNDDFLLPNALNPGFVVAVAKAVEQAARKDGVARA